ncbi:MAG TPA: stress response translation initiation inhibitor YciH [Thermoanaerobaculia bacterium]|jgi:translation initiation factor 1
MSGTSGKARLVWSSEGSRGTSAKAAKVCPRCGADPCRCEPVRSLPPAGQPVRVRREKGGRGGKTVTVSGPLVLTRDDASALLAAWKKLCGGGGTLRTVRTSGAGGDGAAFEVEVQGDHAERILAALTAAGYPAKRSGG